jgi:purine-nucleoside phosphorylase
MAAAKTAIVLGSGLGALADFVEIDSIVSFEEAGILSSRVSGHAGRFLIGRLGKREVIVMRGRLHLYEGHDAKAVAAGIRWLHEWGVETVVLTNAAGTLHPEHPPGHWMMITDHLNLTGTSPLEGGPNFVDMTSVYDPRLQIGFSQLAESAGLPLHEGVYAGLRGPQYETPAEIRMLRTLGADAVGMSTVLEAIQARALGMRVAAFSCLTNWAAGMSGEFLSHDEVISTGGDAAPGMTELLKAWCAQETT